MKGADAALWRTMMRNSFSPADWFSRDGDDKGHAAGGGEGEVAAVWVYRESDEVCFIWIVGYYDPNGTWHQDSEHKSKESAANRTHWLNGGGKQYRGVRGTPEVNGRVGSLTWSKTGRVRTTVTPASASRFDSSLNYYNSMHCGSE